MIYVLEILAGETGRSLLADCSSLLWEFLVSERLQNHGGNHLRNERVSPGLDTYTHTHIYPHMYVHQRTHGRPHIYRQIYGGKGNLIKSNKLLFVIHSAFCCYNLYFSNNIVVVIKYVNKNRKSKSPNAWYYSINVAVNYHFSGRTKYTPSVVVGQLVSNMQWKTA